LKTNGGHTDTAELKGLHLMEVVKEAVVLSHPRGAWVVICVRTVPRVVAGLPTATAKSPRGHQNLISLILLKFSD